MSTPFMIQEVLHDFDNADGTADAVEIVLKTTHGDFTIWCQTAGQPDGKLFVEFGRGDKAACHEVDRD